MKYLICLLLVKSFSSFSQSKEIYDLAFSKKENFELLKIFGGKIPKKFQIMDSTTVLDSKIFYLENYDLKNPKTIQEINNDEHHYYHSLYIFSDKTLDQLVEDSEKEKLSKKANLISVKKIKIQGNNYCTIKKSHKKGFFFIISEPLYSTNGKFAFINIVVKQKSAFPKEYWHEYFATFTIMFQKNEKEKWEQIGIKSHLIQ